MIFGNRNKISKRILKNPDNRATIAGGKKKAVKKLSGFFSKLLMGAVVASFFGIIIYIIFFSPFLVISKIEISGNNYLKIESIRSVVDPQLAGKHLDVANKNNLILASKQSIVDALKKKFKRVDEIEITKVFPDILKIKIKERESAAIFCSQNECFVVDNAGIPYAEADFTANELDESNLLIMHDNSNKKINRMENFVDEGYVSYLLDIKKELKNELDLEIDKNLYTPSLISGDIRARTFAGWEIFFDKSLPIKREISTLKLVLEKIDKETNDKNNRDNLEYIDLRMNNKVFYKFKNSEPTQGEGQKEKSSG